MKKRTTARPRASTPPPARRKNGSPGNRRSSLIEEPADDDEEEDAPKGKKNNIRVPHDTVNEMVLIAAVIVDDRARARYLKTTPSDSFFGSGHAEIWEALQELQRRGLSYDPATLRGVAAKSVDIAYVEDLVEQRPSCPPNLAHHVEALQWDRTRIELASGPLVDLIDALKDRKVTAPTLRGLTKRLESSLVGHGTRERIQRVESVALKHNSMLTQRREGHAFFEVGIPALDYYSEGPRADQPRLLPGTAPGQITVWTGLSGSGKSTTLANALSHMEKNGRRLLVGAWEQSADISLGMIAGIRLGLSRRDLQIGNYTEETQQRILDEMRGMHNLQFLDVPTDSQKKYGANERALDMIEQAIVDTGADVFVADLFRKALREMDPDDEEQTLNRMQAMAQRTNCHFILVQQQRLKDVEQRADKRPTREGIKGSGAWTEVADMILGWHRPAQWKNIADDTIEGLVLKQRYGEWPLAVSMEWDPEYGSIGAGTDIPLDREIGEDESDMDDFLNVARPGKGRRR